MAKIAVSSLRAPSKRQAPARQERPGRLEARILAAGRGWTVEDVLCSCGPEDRPYDEQHGQVTIAIVTSGSFQYRGSGRNGRELMTPGSLLLGSPGQCFECGHEHGVGDRCLSFSFTPDYFQAITAGVGVGTRQFRSLRLPPVRTLSPVIADACAALVGSTDIGWEELGIRLAARAVQVDGDLEPDRSAISPAAVARVTRTVRTIEAQPATELTVVHLARDARLSPFHFLRTFESLTGATPHQYSASGPAARRGDSTDDRRGESSRRCVRCWLRRCLELQPGVSD